MRLVASVVSIAALVSLGCKSSAAVDDAAPVDDTAGQSPVDCGAVLTVPPIVQASDGATGLAICDLTFVVVSSPDGGVGPTSPGAISCAGGAVGCPVPFDSGVPGCAFALAGLSPIAGGGGYTVQVSATGYQPEIISNVVPGVAGCVPARPASHHSVSLVR